MGKSNSTQNKKDRFQIAYEQGTAIYEKNRNQLVTDAQVLSRDLQTYGDGPLSYQQAKNVRRYYTTLQSLSNYGYDTSEPLKAIDGFARANNNLLTEFKTEKDYNAGYLFPTRYSGMDTLGLSKSLDKLRTGGKSTRAEYDWLKQHQYEFWTPEQLRRGIADTQKLIASEKKRGRNNLILKDQLSRMQNAAYSVELKRVDEDGLRGYLARLASYTDKKANTTKAGQSAQMMTPGTNNPLLAIMTSNEASAYDADVAHLRKMFKDKGYSDEKLDALIQYFIQGQHAEERYVEMQDLAEWANKNFGTKALASALSVPLSMAGGLGYADLALKNAAAGTDPITGGRKQVDQYSPMTGMSDASSVIRGSISEEMSPVGSFLYQTGMSILDSRAAMESGNWVGEALLGGSAAMQATRAAYDRGATDWQALAAGAWAGTAETLFEHVSLDKLRIMQSSSSAARRTAKQFLIDLAKQSGVEGSEEAFTTIANKLGDDIIMRDKSELNAAVRAYMEQGMSEEEATKQAWKDWFGQLGLDALGGALSGGVNAGMSMGIGTMQYDAGNRTMGQQIQRTGNASQLVDMGKAMPEGNAAAALAGQIDSANTGRRTARQLGELYTEVQRGNLTQDVQARLEALGSENAAETARALVKQYEGLDLTKAEETLLDTKAARRVATEFSDALEGYEGSNDWAYAAADRQQQLHDSVFTAAEAAESGETVERFAEQYGEQAKAVESLYRDGQDAENFKTSFDAAYTMGQNGASLEAAQRHNAVRGLEPEQVEIAWQMGKDAAHDNTTGGNSNGTEVHLRRSGERPDGARALGEVRGVAEAADRAQAGKKGKNRPADSQALKVSVGEKISALRLGVENGAVAQTVYTVTGNDTKSMKKARALAQEHGKKIVFFAGGNLGVHSRADKSGYVASARGLVQGDTVFVRVDHEQFTADQIMRHEMGHDDVAHGRIDQNAVRERIRAAFGEEQFDAILDLYLQAYAETGMTADEIWEEIVCDSMGDMNIFSDTFEALKKKSAGQLLRATKQAANEMRGEHREQEGRAPPVEAKFSIQTLADGKKYVKVDVDQTQFDGLSEKEQRKLARRIIKKRYVGRVIGTIHQAYVNSRSADEYGHSANRRNVAADIKEAKMRVSTELENLMDVGTNYRTLPDGLYGHSHPRATGGYSYIDVLFEVGDTLYTGTINIENTNRGAVFKDLTQIRNATEGTSGSHEHSSSPTSQDDVSNNSISDSTGKSKQKTSLDLAEMKLLQYETIRDNHPADAIDKVWIRSADDVKTFDEVSGEIDDGENPTPDYTYEMVQKALESGYITVYSSNRIRTGTFVTPSKMEAQNYSADGNVNQMRVPIEHVAWIDIFEGQYTGDVLSERSGKQHFSHDLESLAELRRENRELRERAKKWRRETTRTKAPEVRTEDVRKAARSLIGDMQSTVKVSDITDDLTALAEYMMRGDGKNERAPSWSEVKERAGAIAEKLVDNAETLHEGSDPELYESMKQYVRETKMTIADRDKGDIPNGYEYFRRQNVGILRLGKDGLPVDTAYQQLQDEFGEDYFPADITHPADQLMRIADVVNGLKPAYENPHAYHRAEAVEWAANAIIDTLLSEDVRQTAPTFADRQAAKLDARVAAERDRADARVAAEREKAEARRKAYMQHSNAAIRRVRAQRDRQIARVKQEHRAQKERARERRTRSEMWRGILAMKKDFQRMAEKPEKGNSRHAPMGLAIALRNVADCFDRERGRRDGNVKLPEFKESLMKLRDEYESMKNDGALSFYFDPVVMERLAAVNLELRNVTDPTTLTTGQLGQIYDALHMCKHGITTANKFIALEYSKGIMEAGRQWGGEVMRASPLLKGIGGQLLNYQLRPDSFFARISGFAKGSVGEQVQQMFVGGTEKMLRIQQDFYYSFEKYSTDKRFDALTKRGKALIDVGLKDMDGNTVKLTRDQMLAVYMHLRAEDNLRAAAYGGLDVPNAKAYYTGNVAESFDKSVRTSCIDAAAIDLVREQRELERLAREDDVRGEVRPEIAARLEEVQAELQAMEGEIIGTLLDVRAEIEKQMTDFEKELVETADAWMQKSADYINTETVAMYGIEKANVDHYWTIHRNTNFVNTDMRTAVDEINLENWGSLKERVRSHAPVKLTGFIFELDNHTKKMSQFCGFAAVQRDFNKLYNTRLPGQHSSLSEQVQKKFGSGEKKLGVSGQEYIDNYIKSISGGEHVKPSPIAWFRMNLPRATLSANFRVALSQVASVPTAAAEVGWGAMAKGFARYSVKGISAKQQEQLARTDPWFWQRSRGEGGMREFAEMKESTLAFDRAYNKVAGTKVGKAILNWCQRFDMYATYTQWAMAEEWVKSNRKDLQKGSDEFNEAVSRKYRNIIRKTQPNYTVTERSDLLRDSRETMKWATMYKTQSNQNLNILYDATARLRQYTRDFKAGKNGVTEADLKDARKQFSRAYTGVILGGTVTFVLFRAAANALMHCMNAYRDDDDELTWESFLDGLWQETLGATSGMFLLGSEIEEIIVAAVTGGKYWGLSDSAIGALSDVIEDSLKLLNKVRTGEASWTDYRKVIYSFMAPLGIPGENVAKIVNGVRYHIEDIMNGEFLSFEAGVNRKAKQQANRFMHALRDGDSSKMQRVFDEMIETSGAQDPEKTTRDALRKRIKSAYLGEEDGITISDGEAIKLLEAYGGKSGDDAADLLDEWKFEKEYGIKYSDIKDAYLSGELSEKQYITARVKYGGKSEEDAQTDARKLQCFIDYGVEYGEQSIVDAAVSGEITVEDARTIWMEYGGISEKEADSRVYQLQFVSEHPGTAYDDVKPSAVTGYYEYGQAARIPAEDFMSYMTEIDGYHADVDANGNAISGSKKQKVVNYINSLPISRDQKTALYLSCGYAASKVPSWT